ncbi:tetratricopeptide repeat protein [Agaribacter marinus]|uniref:tetratricopeptide repeat protein n=1 Tax=Agaribacter marinus TaxID=1431249 RepID=UPI0024E195B4|nr:tetratricopeptide repeat protein [Agaribacter marinus]
MDNNQCISTTKTGGRCKNKALASGYCRLHLPQNKTTEGSVHPQSWWAKNKLWVGAGGPIVAGALTLIVSLSTDKPSQAVQINNENSIGVQNNQDGTVNVEINQITGLPDEQYQILLKQFNALKQDKEANQKILNALLEQIDVKNLSNIDLQSKVAEYEKRITELLQDNGVNDEIKSLILEGELDKAEQVADSYVTNQEQKLADSYYQQGQIKELKLKYEEAKIAFEKAAFLEDQNSTHLNKAGLINYTLANYAKAITYYKQALASDLKTYSEGHPSVATRRNNLGLAYKSLGQYEKAIGYYEQALASDLKTYSEGHHSVAITRNNLGLAYGSLGQYEKAIGYYEQALASDLKTYSEGHPSVATRRNNLGSAYKSLGQYEKAIGYYEQALSSGLKTYGEGHPSVAITRSNLGLAYKSLGQYEKAIGYYEQALSVLTKVLGDNHPNTKVVRSNLERAKASLISN